MATHSSILVWRIPLWSGLPSVSWVNRTFHRGGLVGAGSSESCPALPSSSQACAVGLIAVGVGTHLVLNQTITNGATPSFLLPVVIIAVGAFLFLVAFVGCCGACKENYCLMITVSGCGPAWVPGAAKRAFLWVQSSGH